jgi:hypothetical protein
VPDYFLRNLCSPDSTFATNAPENLTARDVRHVQPVVDGLLHPIGHRNCADVPSFPDEVNNAPVLFSALNMVKVQINEFSSTKPAP